MWFIGVEVEQETSAPPPKKNPESAPEYKDFLYETPRMFDILNALFECLCIFRGGTPYNG